MVFDEELSPAQGKNLEQALDRRIMDRSELLILDIFATRAKSSEAEMQVELAQLEYLLPRLARMWVHLSRIRGGIRPRVRDRPSSRPTAGRFAGRSRGSNRSCSVSPVTGRRFARSRGLRPRSEHSPRHL